MQSEHSKQYPFPQQWYAKQRSVVAELLCLDPSELRIREDIRYLNRCAFEGDPPSHCPATGKGSVSLQEFLIFERESVSRTPANRHTFDRY